MFVVVLEVKIGLCELCGTQTLNPIPVYRGYVLPSPRLYFNGYVPLPL